MPEHDARAAPARGVGLKPGQQGCRAALRRCALRLEREPSRSVDEAQAREAVPDEAQALRPLERWIPAVGFVAVQVAEHALRFACERLLQLARASRRGVDVPLRRKSRMQQRHPEPRVPMHHRAGQQPVEDGRAVGRAQHGVERVAAAQARDAECDGEQVQIVIAERHDGGIAKRPDPAQGRE